MFIVCPSCDRKRDDCPRCGGRGTLRIESDPTDTIPLWCYRVAEMADHYSEHGLPPVAGGMLDQSSWFADASSLCISDRERNIAERYGKA